MSSFFFSDERRWPLLVLIQLVSLMLFASKHIQCAGGEGPSTGVKVHGVNEANLDQKYTQLLLDTDDVGEPGAFIQLNCALSTFLLVRKIIEIRQHPKQKEKLKGWLKEKGKKKTKGEEEAKRNVKLKDFQNRIEEFDKMQNGKHFDGDNCQWKTFYVLSDLHDLLQQVHQHGRDIGQLLIGLTKEEANKAREARHRDVLMLQLVKEWHDNNRGELINRILDQHLIDTEQMLAMKRRLRLLVGEYMFDGIEMLEPIIFRIDLIVPAHLLSMYQKLLSIRVDESAKQMPVLNQISIARIVSIILHQKLGQADQVEFIANFQKYWKEKVQKMASDFNATLFNLAKLWEFYFQNNNQDLKNSLEELNNLIVEEEKKSVLELFSVEKLGEKFKQFLDLTRGAKGRLINMLSYGVDAHKFVLENGELARRMVGEDPSHEEMLNEMLLKRYTELFSANDNDTSEKAHLAADVLLHIRELNRKFNITTSMAHNNQWTLYRAMFLIFVDQLEDAKPAFVRIFGSLYKRMLFKLRGLDKVHEHVNTIEAVLSNQFLALTEFSGVLESKGTLSLPAVVILTNAQEVEQMQKEHQWIKGTKYVEKLEKSLSPEGRNKMHSFMKMEDSDRIKSGGDENIHAFASASTSSAIPISSYYECPSIEDDAIKAINPKDKGYDQLMAYEKYLTKKDEAKNEWEKKIDLYMAIWHYKKLIEKMLSSIEKKFPENFKAFNIVWTVPERLETNKQERLEQKLCSFFRFIHLFYEFLQRKIIEKPEEELVEKLLTEVQMIVEFPEDDDRTFSNANKLHCNIDDSPDIAKKMINKLDKKESHFHHLDFLFKEYEVFNLFFCEQTFVLKGHLNELLGPKWLDLLERWHPDVLKINDFHDDVRFYQYEQFAVSRKDSTEALDAEYRLIFTNAIIHLKNTEIMDAWNFSSEDVHGAVKKKAKWLKQLIFGHPKGLVSAKNICLFITFRDLVQKWCHYNIVQAEQAANMVAAWNGEECVDKAQVNLIVLQQRSALFFWHENFLLSHLEGTRQLFKKPGRRTRLRRLVPGLNLPYEKKILFNDDDLVRDRIQFSLLTKDEELREQNRFGLNFVSWARWMDAELAEKNDKDHHHRQSLGQQIMRELWNDDKERLKILRKFDAIFDEYLSDLHGQFGLRLARMQAGLKSLVEKWRDDSKVKLNEWWRKLAKEEFDAEMEPSDMSVRSWKNKKNTFELFLQDLNRQQILKQLSKSRPKKRSSASEKEEFEAIQLWRQHLQLTLAEDKEARKRLPTVFGRSRAGIESILKALALETVDLDELGLIDDLPKDDKSVENEKLEKRSDSETKKTVVNASEQHEAIGSSSQAEKATSSSQADDHIRKIDAIAVPEVEVKEEVIETQAATAVLALIDEPKNGEDENQKEKDSAVQTSNKKKDVIVGLHTISSKHTSSSMRASPAGSAEMSQTVSVVQSAAIDGHSRVGKKKRDKKEKTEASSSLSSHHPASPKAPISAADESKSEVLSSRLTPREAKKNRRRWNKKEKQGSSSIVEPEIGEEEEKGRKVHLEDSDKEKGVSSALPQALLESPTQEVEQTPIIVSSASRVEENDLMKLAEIEATAPLLDILREEGYLETPEMNQKIEAAIEEMRRIVQNWNNDAILLVGGSYLLKLHTTHSDIDTVLLLPFEEENAEDWIGLRQQHFFGYPGNDELELEEEEVNCNLESTQRHCPNRSLYCELCKKGVTFLLRMTGRDGDPMLKLKFRNFDFDISFVPIPNVRLMEFYAGSTEKDTLELLSSVEKFDLLIAGFIDWIGFENHDSRKGMLWALSAYRANLRIRDLLKERPKDVFQPALLALKLWAKNHFVYGSLFGLLNGTALTTMLLDVFVKNSQDSVPLLLEKFFDTFYYWKWPNLVELDRKLTVGSKYEVYDWKVNTELYSRSNQLKVHVYAFLIEEHTQLVWPVIVPGFPTQNAAFNVNSWTKQAIRREFGQALDQVKAVRRQIGAKTQPMEKIRKKWDRWLNGGRRFENKYDHFVAIVCAVDSAQQGSKFCDFVESRIRLQLLFAFGDLPQVKWMHASPERVRNGAPCPSGEEMARLPAGNWLCTIWLVGVQLVEGSEQQAMEKDIRQTLEEKMTKMDFASERIEETKENIAKPSRLEIFTQKIYDSFKYRESRRTSSPRSIHRSNSSLSTTYSAESPRGSGNKSPLGTKSHSIAGSPRQFAPADFNRQGSMPILQESASAEYTRQSSLSTLRHTAPAFYPQGSILSEIDGQASMPLPEHTLQSSIMPSAIESHRAESPRGDAESPKPGSPSDKAGSPRRSAPEYKSQRSMPILRHSAPEYIPSGSMKSVIETSMPIPGVGDAESAAPGSPRSNADSPRQLALAAFNRQSSLPTSQESTREYTRQGSMPSASIAREASMSQILETEVINEMVWAKYLDKALLHAWLKKMAV